MSYKPSPLSYGSPRASPFRRPESPASPSPLRQSTPTPSPTKMATVSTTPSRFAQNSTPTETKPDSDSWTPRGLAQFATSSSKSQRRERDTSPTPVRGANSPGFGGMLTNRHNSVDASTALSKLQPPQVRELREGFQILDRDSDGQVGREDIADMLTQLGIFPFPNHPQNFLTNTMQAYQQTPPT